MIQIWDIYRAYWRTTLWKMSVQHLNVYSANHLVSSNEVPNSFQFRRPCLWLFAPTLWLFEPTLWPVLLTLRPVGRTLWPVALTLWPVVLTFRPVGPTLWPVSLTQWPVVLTLWPVRLNLDRLLWHCDHLGRKYVGNST